MTVMLDDGDAWKGTRFKKKRAEMSYCRFELQTHALKGRCSTY